MTFSVLMSVYNKETPANLDRALKSNLEDQTLGPNQLVLVCDGPLDVALNDVISKYEQRYPSIFEVYRLEKNSGLGNALNYGLQFCNSEIVARSDSDDVCLPYRFERQITYMENNPAISASSGTIDEFKSDYNNPLRIKYMPTNHDDLVEYAKTRNPLNHMAAAFRKSDVMAVGSYQQLQYREDYYLWVRLLAAGKKLGNLKDVLVHACIGNGMTERRGDLRYIQGWITLNRFMIKHNMLSYWQFMLNIGKLCIWCSLSVKTRTYIYNRLLRQK